MNKQKAIELLNHEGWTKADAQRALETIDFKINKDVDELTIRRTASKFAGAELLDRQRLQAAQKGMVTKKNKEIQIYVSQIEELTSDIGSDRSKDSAELEQEIRKLTDKINKLVLDNDELVLANDNLKKDNRNLKNIVDEIRFKLTVEVKELLNLKNIIEIRKRLIKLLKSTLG